MSAQASGTLAAAGSVTLTKPGSDNMATGLLSGTYGSNTYVVEATVDGTNYGAVPAFINGALVTGTISPTDNTTYVLKIPSGGCNGVRIRRTDVAGTGTLAVALNSTAENFPFTYTIQTSASVLTIGASTVAAGSTAATAAALPAGTGGLYPTTAADDTKGVILSTSDLVTGRPIFIGNGVSNKILKVYPPTGGVINGAAADAAYSSASGKGVKIYCLSGSGNTWLATG